MTVDYIAKNKVFQEKFVDIVMIGYQKAILFKMTEECQHE